MRALILILVGFVTSVAAAQNENPAQFAASGGQEFYDVSCTQSQQYQNVQTGELVKPAGSQITLQGQTIQWREDGKSYTVAVYRSDAVHPRGSRQLVVLQQISNEAAGPAANETLIDRQTRSIWWNQPEGFRAEDTRAKISRTVDGERFADHILAGASESLRDSQGVLQKFPDGRQVTTEVRTNFAVESSGYRLLSVTDVCRYLPKKDFILTGLDPAVHAAIGRFSIQHAITHERWRQNHECRATGDEAACAAQAAAFTAEDSKRDTLWTSLFPTETLAKPGARSFVRAPTTEAPPSPAPDVETPAAEPPTAASGADDEPPVDLPKVSGSTKPTKPVVIKAPLIRPARPTTPEAKPSALPPAPVTAPARIPHKKKRLPRRKPLPRGPASPWPEQQRDDGDSWWPFD